jgi:uncharacterized protein (AIM24 family)
MEIRIQQNPQYRLAQIALAPGESVLCESGAIFQKPKSIEAETISFASKSPTPPVLRRFKNMPTGKSRFFCRLTNVDKTPQSVVLAPPLPGEVERVLINATQWILRPGQVLAFSPDLTLDSSLQTKKQPFAKIDSDWALTKGTGELVLYSFGGLIKQNIESPTLCNLDRLIAFEASLALAPQQSRDQNLGTLTGKGIAFFQAHSY